MVAKTDSPFAEKQVKSGPKFGMTFLLLMMVIFASCFAALGLAIRVPAVTSEINAWLGQPTDQAALDRSAQVRFAYFCYAAPLLLAIVIQTVSSVTGWFYAQLQKRSELQNAETFGS